MAHEIDRLLATPTMRPCLPERSDIGALFSKSLVRGPWWLKQGPRTDYGSRTKDGPRPKDEGLRTYLERLRPGGPWRRAARDMLPCGGRPPPCRMPPREGPPDMLPFDRLPNCCC